MTSFASEFKSLRPRPLTTEFMACHGTLADHMPPRDRTRWRGCLFQLVLQALDLCMCCCQLLSKSRRQDPSQVQKCFERLLRFGHPSGQIIDSLLCLRFPLSANGNCGNDFWSPLSALLRLRESDAAYGTPAGRACDTEIQALLQLRGRVGSLALAEKAADAQQRQQHLTALTALTSLSLSLSLAPKAPALCRLLQPHGSGPPGARGHQGRQESKQVLGPGSFRLASFSSKACRSVRISSSAVEPCAELQRSAGKTRHILSHPSPVEQPCSCPF